MSDNRPSILIIEDELPIRRFLRAGLSAELYHLSEAATAQDGLIQAAAARPDLIILDLGLPDGDGIDVTKQLREWTSVPIIVLSARGQEQDKVEALDAGADDYITKPFGVAELHARMRVALRHAAQYSTEPNPIFTSGDLRVDLARRSVTVAEREVHLTPLEYRLLAILIKYAGKVVTHRQLLREVWGQGYEGENHYLRVYTGQLRQKLEADPTRPKLLQTETGVGYRLRVEE